MAITIDDLTVNFGHLEKETLLEDWRWLIGETKLPILLSSMGDAFVQDVEDGSIMMVDTGYGELCAIADTLDEFTALLNDKDFVARALGVQGFGALRQAGKTLEPGQIFSFKVPPGLGGAHVLDNIEPTDISVHFSVAGQIFKRLNDLPEGAAIAGVTITQ